MTTTLSLDDIKSQLTPEQWEAHQKEFEKIAREEVKLLEKLERDQKDYPCEYLKLWKWQKRAIEEIPKCNILVVPAPNKIGKCICIGSMVDTPNGEIDIGELYNAGVPFQVFAWNGKEKVVAWAHAPFKKEGLHKCYRITMSDGRWIEAADHHKILTDEGWQSVQDLYEYLQSLPVSTAESYLSVHVASVQRLNQKQSDSQDDYPAGRRLCGERFPSDVNSDQVFSPLRDGVLKHNDQSFDRDVLANKYNGILSQSLFLPSNLYDLLHFWARYVVSLFHAFCKYFRPSLLGYSIFRQPSNAVALDPRPTPLFDFPNPRISDSSGIYQDSSSLTSDDQDYRSSYNLLSKNIIPIMPDGNYIIAITYIGVEECFDFTVEKYHNYFAGGLIHHNTTIMVNILNAIALGYSPWTRTHIQKPDYMRVGRYWYRPAPYHKKPPIRIRITGENWRAHIQEVIVHEFKQWASRSTYNSDIDINEKNDTIKYTNGSTIQFMTYNAAIDVYESWTGDIWCPDEPPPLKIFEAMERGLHINGGKTFMFMTPLKEPWILNKIIEPDYARFDVNIIDELTFLDNENLVAEDTAELERGGALAGDIDEYFRLLLDYDNRSKGEHVGLINTHIRKIIDPYYFIEIIQKLQGLKRINDTEEENRDARFKGKFKHLVGLIYKSYKDFYYPNGHLVKPFKLDTDWPVICEIDWHHSIPPFLGFYAWDKENRMYIVKEIFVQMTGEQVAHEIIRQKKTNAWRLKKVYCDPLAKGNDKMSANTTQMSEDTFTTMKKILNKEGILINTTGLEKTMKNRGEWTGIDRVRDRLSPSSGVPRLLVFDNCMYHRKGFKQWVYVDEKPSDDDDHPMETTYRAVLSNTKYTDPNKYKDFKSKPDKGII